MKELKDRLQIALDLKEKKPADLSKDLKIPKAAISQYLSGKTKKMDAKRIYSIAKYLNVSDAWLMGFDVPMERNDVSRKGKAQMNELKIFNNAEFGQVRTIQLNNEPLFCLGDLCKALELTAKGVKQRLSDEVISSYPIEDSIGRTQNTLFVNEDGLYDVILESRKESAKRFRKWVTSEILPSIRKTGGYIAGQENMTDAELMAKALMVAQKQIEERNKQIEVLQPKALFADAVSASDKSILIGELAKLIKQNGVDMGQNRLFQWMRDNGFLIRRKGTDYNMPTQYSMELGLFSIKETTITHSDGHISISKTVKVTGKGQVYFINKFL